MNERETERMNERERERERERETPNFFIHNNMLLVKKTGFLPTAPMKLYWLGRINNLFKRMDAMCNVQNWVKNVFPCGSPF